MNKYKMIFLLFFAGISINSFADDKIEKIADNINDFEYFKIKDNSLKRIILKDGTTLFFKFDYDNNHSKYGSNLSVILNEKNSTMLDFLKETEIVSKLKKQNVIAIDLNSNSNLTSKDIFENISKFSKLINIDNINLYGFADGATLINSMICENSKYFAYKRTNVVNVNGSVDLKFNSSECNLTNLHYVFIAGELDDYYTYNGEPQIKNSFNFKNTDNILLKSLKCYESPNVFNLIDLNTSDKTEVKNSSYICDQINKNYYDFLFVKNMGHNWIDVSNSVDSIFRGNSNYELTIPFILKNIIKR